MKYCANCGSKLADNMRFCPECGVDQRLYRPDAGMTQDYNDGFDAGFDEGFQHGANHYQAVRRWSYPFEKRNIVLAIIFSFITFGIYYLFWVYQLISSWNYISEEQGRKPGMSPWLVIVLAIVTFGIFMIYYWYRISKQIADLDDRNGDPLEDHSIVCLLFSLFGLGIVSAAIVQNSLNYYLEFEL